MSRPKLSSQSELTEPKRPLPSLALQDDERHFNKIVENELVNFVQYLEDVADDGGASGKDEDMKRYLQIRRSWAKSLHITLGRVDYGLLATLEWIVNWYTVYKPNEERNRSQEKVRFKGMCLTASISTMSRQLHLSRPAIQHNLGKLADLKLIRIEPTEGNMGYRIEIEPGNLERLYHGLPLADDAMVPMGFFDTNPHTIKPGCRMSPQSKEKAPARLQQPLLESSTPLLESVTTPAGVQQDLLESEHNPAGVQHRLSSYKRHVTTVNDKHQKQILSLESKRPSQGEPSVPSKEEAEEAARLARNKNLNAWYARIGELQAKIKELSEWRSSNRDHSLVRSGRTDKEIKSLQTELQTLQGGPDVPVRRKAAPPAPPAPIDRQTVPPAVIAARRASQSNLAEPAEPEGRKEQFAVTVDVAETVNLEV